MYAQKHIHSETGETSLPHFLHVCKNSFGVTIGTLRADLGLEFVTKALAKVCKENGVCQEFFATAKPMQNGQVERDNISIGEAMKAMLLESGLHSQFSAEAAKMSVYVHNLLPGKKLCRRSP